MAASGASVVIALGTVGQLSVSVELMKKWALTTTTLAELGR